MAMEENLDITGHRSNTPGGENIPDRNSIAADRDTLEPFDDSDEKRVINADDPKDLARWADEFRISLADLKAAMLLNGSSVREVKKYLSV